MGGRARQEEVDLLLIDDPAGDGLPAGDELDLVEEQGRSRAVANAGDLAEPLLDHPAQVGGGHAVQALVLQVEVQQRLAWRASGQALSKALPQERRLAAAAHADHGVRLPCDLREADIALGQRRDGHRQGVGDALAEDCLDVTHGR